MVNGEIESRDVYSSKVVDTKNVMDEQGRTLEERLSPATQDDINELFRE